MTFDDLKWKLIIFSGLGAAVGINILILLLAVIFFRSGIIADKTAVEIELYLFAFAIFSPLTASLISSGIVTAFSRHRKLVHTACSTVLTFVSTVLILALITSPVGLAIYSDFDKRVNPCHYETCGE